MPRALRLVTVQWSHNAKFITPPTKTSTFDVLVLFLEEADL